jgi:hypothetical protein
VRIVRFSGLRPEERAIVLTDVLQHDGHTYIKPLLIALPNRHNMLFDLEQATLASWWVGDAAQQRTKGKSWYWEATEDPLFPATIGKCDLSLIVDGKMLEPNRTGQFITQFDEIRHDENAVQFSYHLTFGDHIVHVQQTIVPNPLGGVVRRINVSSLPSNASLQLRLYDGQKLRDNPISPESRHALKIPNRGSISLVTPARPLIDPQEGTVKVEADDGRARIELIYSSVAQVEAIADTNSTSRTHTPDVLRIVPGFEAVRLPTSDEIMPTGLSWTPTGELVITSLKGQVLRLSDGDGDGLEDGMQLASDELAAPYGIVAKSDYLDVINKYALLRLFDEDHDGFAERTVTLASGWGHTSDYHDWAIGLLPDGADGYFIALPCQQDERSRDAAQFRGTLLQLVPRTASADDPRLFELRPISSGHRFPMGLVRNEAGDLFVTDNQGNYNPFNELNHVRPGAHYGFINTIDRAGGAAPPPLSPPAINIPHPWTRSVNGVCLLKTPSAIDGEKKRFGPFEGHILGCEFDTRRLVRMSLEKVGDTYQGAIYPFSSEQIEEVGSETQPTRRPSFIGPIVADVSPRGDIYVGCLRDSGWGGSNNVGGLVRLRPTIEQLPAGIAEVQVRPHGFRSLLTKPIDGTRALLPSSYVINSYRRISTSDYGGPDVDRRVEKPLAVRVSEDATFVDIELAEMRAGFVYEFHLRNLALQDSNSSTTFFPAEAYYTLNVVPQ